MTKRLCKYNRVEIADNLNVIHSLVLQPKFLCRSCARSSSDKQSLCKPTAVPSASSHHSLSCGAHASASEGQTRLLPIEPVSFDADMPSHLANGLVDKLAVVKAKKSLKKQKKYHKRLKELAKKQKQLLKKQKKIKKQFAKLEVETDKLTTVAVKHPSESTAKQLH